MMWRAVRLEDCVSLASGGTPSKANAQLWQGDIPWVSCKDMKLLRLHDTEDHVSQEAIGNGTRLVPGGTILIVVRGMILAKDFPVAEAQRPLTFNQDLKAVTVLPGVESRFLLYWFLAHRDLLMSACDEAAHGTKRLQTDRLLGMPVLLPEVATQRRIASILSAYDDLIENNTRRIAILEEMARRIYEEWFVRFRFPGHENVRMVESELGLVPEGWELTSLGAVAENHDRFRRPLSKMERADFKGPYPYYGAAKIFDYVREYLFDGQFLLLAEDGSVETPDGHPVLQLTDGKFWANNHTHILQGTKRASTEFLYLRLERQPIRGYITGAAQPKLTQAAINRIPLVLPPSNVLREFDAQVQPLFQFRATLIRANTNLRTTRDLLLPKLISGELSVESIEMAREAP